MREHPVVREARRPRILLTALEPYGEWDENASVPVLERLRQAPPPGVLLQARVYPVDYAELARRLAADLAGAFDWAVHLGQAPGRGRVEVEAVARNARSDGEGATASEPLVAAGPEVLFSNVPVESWVRRLRARGVPAAISTDAGRFLCNASLYQSLLICRRLGLATRSAFVHVPVMPGQALRAARPMPALPSARVAEALRPILARPAG